MDPQLLSLIPALALTALIAVVPATIAYRKGRNFFGFWIVSCALLIVALPVAIFMKPDHEALDRRRAAKGERRCPSCREWVRDDATACPHCTRAITAT